MKNLTFENEKASNSTTYGKRDDDDQRNSKKINIGSVKNRNNVEDWKSRPGNKLDVSFAQKVRDARDLVDIKCEPCLKLHTKGIGYRDCKHRKSHRKLSG